ncbi:MAG: hypothetical protein AAGU11_03350, partial [Syntrophobacteraceae bacterium]
ILLRLVIKWPVKTANIKIDFHLLPHIRICGEKLTRTNSEQPCRDTQLRNLTLIVDIRDNSLPPLKVFRSSPSWKLGDRISVL